MSFHFDQKKAEQCVAYLLAKTPKARHSMGCVLKILYMADRKSIAETGSPITGDKPSALQHGMILSQTYDLAKSGERVSLESQADWDQYFQRQGNDLVLTADPGNGMLSKYDRRVLDEVWTQLGGMAFGQLKKLTHDLPEYKKSFDEDDELKKSFPVGLATILDAVGRKDDYEQIIQQRAADIHFAKLFSAKHS